MTPKRLTDDEVDKLKAELADSPQHVAFEAAVSILTELRLTVLEAQEARKDLRQAVKDARQEITKWAEGEARDTLVNKLEQAAKALR